MFTSIKPIKPIKSTWGGAVVFALVVASSYLALTNESRAGDDDRAAIVLTEKERGFVLVEMREFLEKVQAIVEALAENDLKQVAVSAKSVGMALAGTVPAPVAQKLPEAFRQLAVKTHKAFDDIADEAATMGDGQVILQKLGAQLQNCTACHASYRFEIGK